MPKRELHPFRIGYARVSTHEQNLEMQLDALKKTGCKRIFTDKLSGAQVERPGLKEALSQLRQADTLMVWKLDRLGRSVKGLVDLVNELETQKVHFQSITDGIDTKIRVSKVKGKMTRWKPYRTGIIYLVLRSALMPNCFALHAFGSWPVRGLSKVADFSLLTIKQSHRTLIAVRNDFSCNRVMAETVAMEARWRRTARSWNAIFAKRPEADRLYDSL